MQVPFRKATVGVTGKIKRISWRKVTYGVFALVVAATAGYFGGQLGQPNEPVTNDLSGQKQIVTSQGQLINKIAREAGPSVVSITVTTQATSESFFGFGSQPYDQQSAGTGIIISKDGVILTNRHVVPTGTSNVSITLSDGTQFDDVKVIGRTNASDSLDVAFLKIQNLDGKKLTPALIGSSSSAKVGDAVVAIGNALGEFQNTVTSGIISGFGRQVEASNGESFTADAEYLGNLIQTDTAINQGNSGGPLVNMNGEVIGINTAVASGAENIGFAIPIDDVSGLIRQILETGSFARPFLGVRYVTLTPAIAEEFALSEEQGAYVAPRGITGSDPIIADSPADKAGLKAGDVITAINGKKLTQQNPLISVLNRYEPESKVRLEVLRDGKKMMLTVTLGKVDADTN